MTSETAFSEQHTSTWRLLAPTIDLYVRKINLDLYEREFPVLVSEVDPDRRGFINELAFNIFCQSPQDDPIIKYSQEVFDQATNDARQKISRLEKRKDLKITDPEPKEVDDCVEQVRRLRLFFQRASSKSHLEMHPRFRGAGFVDSCEGDVYFNSILFEIKAGQRPFRAVDIKQLLIYAALNFVERVRPISEMSLFNPRMGVSFKAKIDDICYETSGSTAAELLQEIIRIVSGGELSR